MGAPKAEIPNNQREFRLQTIHHSLMPTINDNRLIGDIHADFGSQKINLDSILRKIRMKSPTQPVDIIQWAQFTFLDIHSTPTNTTIPTETLSETQKTNFPIFLERRICCQKAVCALRAGSGWSTSKIGRSMKVRIFALYDRP